MVLLMTVLSWILHLIDGATQCCDGHSVVQV
jgi:hypothetical protein